MYILKFLKMKLLDRAPEKKPKKQPSNIDDVISAANTMILTNLKQDSHMFGKSILETEQSNDQKMSTAENRELFLANIVSYIYHLGSDVIIIYSQILMHFQICNFEERGINLRATYPKIYSDLCRYVDEGTGFAPVCLFPRDMNKNNLFMCLIMPNSEPANYAWFYDYENKASKSGNKRVDSCCLTATGQQKLPSKIKVEPGSFVLSDYVSVV